MTAPRINKYRLFRGLCNSFGIVCFSAGVYGTVATVHLVWFALSTVGAFLLLAADITKEMEIDDAALKGAPAENVATYDSIVYQRKQRFDEAYKAVVGDKADKARAMGSMHDGQEL